MSKALENGKSLAELIIAKLPEGHRKAVQEILAGPEGTDALTLLGDAALARADYSRLMDGLKVKETELATREGVLQSDFEKMDQWWGQNKDKIGKLEAEIARLQGKEPPADGGNKQPPADGGSKGLTKEDVLALFEQRDRGYAGVLALATEIGTKHLHTFGEPADMRGVIDLAGKKGISLEDAYKEKYGPQLTERAQKLEDERINKIVDERVAAKRKEESLNPIPLRPGASVLDILESPTDKPANHTVDSATALYESLVSASSR